MSKEKAQQLIALLGDRQESVLSLLAEDHARFLRENPVEAQNVNPLEVDELLDELLHTQAPETTEANTETLEKAADDLNLDSEEAALFGEEESAVQAPETVATSEEDLFGETDTPTQMDDSFSLDADPLSDIEAGEDAGEDYKTVADMLEQQNPQLVSFFLNKLAEDKRDHLLQHLPQQFQDDLQTLAVEDIPISDEVFEDLYNELFKGWN